MVGVDVRSLGLPFLVEYCKALVIFYIFVIFYYFYDSRRRAEPGEISIFYLSGVFDRVLELGGSGRPLVLRCGRVFGFLRCFEVGIIPYCYWYHNIQ